MKLCIVSVCTPALLSAHLLRQNSQVQVAVDSTVKHSFLITANGTRLEGQHSVEADIIIAMEAAYPPFNDFDPVHGGLWGFDVEMVERVCPAAGISCAVVTVPFQNAWPGHEKAFMGEGFLNHQFDCMTGSGNTMPRRTTLKFSDPYTAEVRGAFIGKIGEPLFKDPTAVEDTTNKRIGTVDGWSCGEWFVKRTLPKTKSVTPFPSPKAMIDALSAGEIDYAVACPIATAARILDQEKHDIVGSVGNFNDGLAFMCHPQAAHKLVQLNKGIKAVRQDGSLKTICKHYPRVYCDFERHFGPEHGGVGEEAWPSDLVISMEAAFPPFNDFDQVNGLQGFDVDLVPLVCDAAKITCAVVTAPFVTAWPGHAKAFMGEGLLNHEYDCVTASANTFARRQSLKFSSPYSEPVMGAFVGKKGTKLQSDGTGARIGTITAFSCGKNFVYRTMPNAATVQEYPSAMKLFDALDSGAITVALTCPIAQAKKSMNPQAHEIVRTVDGFNEGLAFMCHPGDAKKIKALNYGLQEVVKNGKLKELCAKYPDIKCDLSNRHFSLEHGGVEVPSSAVTFAHSWDHVSENGPHSDASGSELALALILALSATVV